MRNITITKIFDAHVHLRNGERLKLVVPYTAQYASRYLVMPNTRPQAVLNDATLSQYRKEIVGVTGLGNGFKPLMTFEIRPETQPVDIVALKCAGAIAGKIYPKGMTTNAEHGVQDYFALADVLREMEQQELVLCLHGEQPGAEWKGKNREKAFLRETLPFLVRMFPTLKIVMEHITTRVAVEAVLAFPDTVGATITAHHLVLTRNDVAGDQMNPNHWCKPVAKKESDRQALVKAAVSGCRKFFFGSDSAPHSREGKERLYDCCAGIFTAPITVPLLLKVFDENNAVARLKVFTREAGKEFYGWDDRSPDKITFVDQPMIVPEQIGDVVPFLPGQSLPWSMVE